MPEVEETTEGHPRDLVLENARRKAAAVDGDDVLGADTTVVAGRGDPGQAGGPRRRPAATSSACRGGTHEVWSAVALPGRARGAT